MYSKQDSQIEIPIVDRQELENSHDHERQEAINRLRKLRRPLPADFRFDREEANDRTSEP